MRQKLLLVTGTGTVPPARYRGTLVGMIKRIIIQRLCYDPIVTYTESPPPVLVGPLVGVNILVVSSGLQVSRARTRRTTAAAKEHPAPRLRSRTAPSA